ncbi:MAG TPA: ABC transporter permease [Stellaceae bacterium]|nr:ABC transporter permease [Stellaceae bacterium]
MAAVGRMKAMVPGAATIVLCLIAWQAVSHFFIPIFFPGPILLARRMVEIYSDPASWDVVAVTLVRIAEGFALSMVLGIALGLVMGLKRDVEIFLDAWIMVLLTFPAICWAFLSVLWFGLSNVAPVLTVFLIVLPFVVLNIWQGTKAVEKNLLEMGRVYKADRALMLRKVLMPQLMPYVFSSLRIALSLSWRIVLVGEAFGVGSGVGQKLMFWFQQTRVDMMLAWGMSFMIVMTLVDLFVFRLWARRSFAWRRQAAI